MVCETSGAWAPEALNVLKLIAKCAAKRTGADNKQLERELLQRCAAAVRKANAKAHFKRADAMADGVAPSAARTLLAAPAGA